MRIAVAVAVACLSVAGVSIAENAHAAIRRPTHIPEQSLDSALQALAKARDLQMIYSYEIVGELRTRGANGDLTFEEAISSLLSGTGLAYRYLDDKTVTIVPLVSTPAAPASDARRTGAEAPPAASLDPQSQWSVSERRKYGWLTLTQAGDPATEAAQAGDGSLGEIVVTAQRKFRPETSNAASKFELPIIETPQALTVLSSEFLNIARLNDTAGVVAYTPGVELQGMGDGTEAGISARGFQINRERAFRVNGLSTDSEVDLDYFAMDRVEIVRGPASSLYGEADYGATFNRVLKAPGGKSGATVGIELGSYDFRRLQGDIQGVFGESGAVSGRAIAAVQDSGTFIRGTEDDRVLVAPSLAIDLDRTRVLLQGYYQKLDGVASDGFSLIPGASGYSLPNQSPRNNYGLDINETDSENAFVFAQVDHRLSDTLGVAFKMGYARIDLNNMSSYLWGADPDGNATLYSYPEVKTKEDLSLDASLEKKFEIAGREQRFLLSADWRQNDYFQNTAYSFAVGAINVHEGGPLTGYAPTTPPLPAVTDEFVSSKDLFSGATALAHLKPTERIALLVGLRYSAVETSVNNNAPTTWGSVQKLDGIEDSAWVPRAALVYRLREGHNAYLSYSEGIIFNQGLLREDGSTIDPETGVQYELGFKGELFDRRVMYSAAAFQITRTDVAAGVFEPGQPVYFYNVGKQVHRGGEIELIGEPIPGLNLIASYSNLDVDIRESANPFEVGHTPIAAPAHSYSLFATYEMLSGPMRSLTFGGGIVGRSEREVDSVGTFQLPSYTRVDFRASYDLSEALSIEVNLQNAFNERIYTSVYSSADGGIGFVYPRMAAGRISYRW
jgi:TonB-dependent siderophore receptor